MSCVRARPLIVIGAGGHAKVLLDVLLAQSCKVLGLVTPDWRVALSPLPGVPILGDDEALWGYPPDTVQLVNGVGSVDLSGRRRMVFEKFNNAGYHFATVIHASAIISPYSHLGEGVQIMAGAIVQAGSFLGDNTILNTKASLDHDCQIGRHVHIAPGATLSGGIRVDDRVHIGTGAIVIQGLHIAADTIIGAGTLVLKNIPAGAKVIGVPGKVVNYDQLEGVTDISSSDDPGDDSSHRK